MLKKALVSLSVCAVLFASAAFADQSNWTETFNLKGGMTIQHTPESVSFNGITSKGIHIHAPSIGGVATSHCGFFGTDGLDVTADMSRGEFKHALECSGLYDGK